MGVNAGNLLWHRMRITLASGSGAGNLINTGLRQSIAGYAKNSDREPPLDGTVLVGSRVQVIPMPPTLAWASISHEEPHLALAAGATAETVHVQFTTDGSSAEINVLFWDPHSIAGPGNADPYT